MKEKDWGKFVADKLNITLLGFTVTTGKRLIYANELIEYSHNATFYNNGI